LPTAYDEIQDVHSILLTLSVFYLYQRLTLPQICTRRFLLLTFFFFHIIYLLRDTDNVHHPTYCAQDIKLDLLGTLQGQCDLRYRNQQTFKFKKHFTIHGAVFQTGNPCRNPLNDSRYSNDLSLLLSFLPLTTMSDQSI
jgi:hypothetical protein